VLQTLLAWIEVCRDEMATLAHDLNVTRRFYGGGSQWEDAIPNVTGPDGAAASEQQAQQSSAELAAGAPVGW
jgi:hypothetical protein